MKKKDSEKEGSEKEGRKQEQETVSRKDIENTSAIKEKELMPAFIKRG